MIMKKKKNLDLRKVKIASMDTITRIYGGDTVVDTNTNPHTHNCSPDDTRNTSLTITQGCVTIEFTCNNTNQSRPQSQNCPSIGCVNSLDTFNCP